MLAYHSDIIAEVLFTLFYFFAAIALSISASRQPQINLTVSKVFAPELLLVLYENPPLSLILIVAINLRNIRLLFPHDVSAEHCHYLRVYVRRGALEKKKC